MPDETTPIPYDPAPGDTYREVNMNTGNDDSLLRWVVVGRVTIDSGRSEPLADGVIARCDGSAKIMCFSMKCWHESGSGPANVVTRRFQPVATNP